MIQGCAGGGGVPWSTQLPYYKHKSKKLPFTTTLFLIEEDCSFQIHNHTDSRYQDTTPVQYDPSNYKPSSIERVKHISEVIETDEALMINEEVDAKEKHNVNTQDYCCNVKSFSLVSAPMKNRTPSTTSTITSTSKMMRRNCS